MTNIPILDYNKINRVIEDLEGNGAKVTILAYVGTHKDGVTYSIIAKWKSGKKWEIKEII